AREAVAELEPLVAEHPTIIGPRAALGTARWFLGRALQATGQRSAARGQLESALDVLGRCYVEDPAKHAELVAGACRELASTLDPASEPDAFLSLLTRAREAQQRLVSMKPQSLPCLEELMQIDVNISLGHARRGDVDAAMAALRANEELIATRSDIGASTVARVHAVAAELLVRSGKEQQGIVRLEQAVAAAQAWVDKEPNRVHPATMVAKLLAQLAFWQGTNGPTEASIETNRAATVATEAWLARATTDLEAKTSLIFSLAGLVRALLEVGDESTFAEAERCARRAVELTETTQNLEPELQLRLRWLALGTLGVAVDDIGLADADATWQETERAMHAWRKDNAVDASFAADYVDFSVRMARRHIAAGRTDDATALLSEVAHLVDEQVPMPPKLAKAAVEAFRLSAVLAVQRHELDIATEHAERAHAVENGWRGWLAASRAMQAICQAARGTADVAFYADHAIQVHERAIEELVAETRSWPEDCSMAGRLAQTRIRLALAQRDCGENVDAGAVAQAIDTLSTLRDRMHAYDWDESLLLAAKAMPAR
ncbi:MAG: hypothetical protein ABIP94_10250, partial [Planctomycetota bacterium]